MSWIISYWIKWLTEQNPEVLMLRNFGRVRAHGEIPETNLVTTIRNSFQRTSEERHTPLWSSSWDTCRRNDKGEVKPTLSQNVLEAIRVDIINSRTECSLVLSTAPNKWADVQVNWLWTVGKNSLSSRKFSSTPLGIYLPPAILGDQGVLKLIA